MCVRECVCGRMREEEEEERRRSVRDVEEGGTMMMMMMADVHRVTRDLDSRRSLTARRQRRRRRRRRRRRTGGGELPQQQRSRRNEERVEEKEEKEEEEGDETDKLILSMRQCEITTSLRARVSDDSEDVFRTDAANTVRDGASSSSSSGQHGHAENVRGINEDGEDATPSPHEDMLDILERMKRRCEAEIPGGNRSNMARACRDAIRVHARAALGDDAWCFDAFLGFS